MTSEGTKYLGALLSGDYAMLWVATPSDWYVRTPGKRAGPHYQRIRNLMVKARAMRMTIVLMGPPGFFLEVRSHTGRYRRFRSTNYANAILPLRY